mgnify:CR=1 FL=1
MRVGAVVMLEHRVQLPHRVLRVGNTLRGNGMRRPQRRSSLAATRVFLLKLKHVTEQMHRLGGIITSPCCDLQPQLIRFSLMSSAKGRARPAPEKGAAQYDLEHKREHTGRIQCGYHDERCACRASVVKVLKNISVFGVIIQINLHYLV